MASPVCCAKFRSTGRIKVRPDDAQVLTLLMVRTLFNPVIFSKVIAEIVAYVSNISDVSVDGNNEFESGRCP